MIIIKAWLILLSPSTLIKRQTHNLSTHLVSLLRLMLVPRQTKSYDPHSLRGLRKSWVTLEREKS